MPLPFTLSIVAPDREVYEDSVVSLVLPGSHGYLGVYQGHEPSVIEMIPGVLEVTSHSGDQQIAVGGGFAEVLSDRVTILADSAELASDINVARAEAALERARKNLRGDASEMSNEEAMQAQQRAQARLRAVRLS